MEWRKLYESKNSLHELIIHRIVLPTVHFSLFNRNPNPIGVIQGTLLFQLSNRLLSTTRTWDNLKKIFSKFYIPSIQVNGTKRSNLT